ncbi:MAG: hypothetical protein GY950_20260 [bacterium]|nr:hypothetical protein [bacterium]
MAGVGEVVAGGGFASAAPTRSPAAQTIDLVIVTGSIFDNLAESGKVVKWKVESSYNNLKRRKP